MINPENLTLLNVIDFFFILLSLYLFFTVIKKTQIQNIKRLDIVKGAGHCPHDEHPEVTNKFICDFIQETK